MSLSRCVLSLACVLAVSLSARSAFAAENEAGLFDPPAIYLEWQHDPTTTMTVHWHTTNVTDTALEFRQKDEADWHKAAGTHARMPDQKTDWTIHTVELTGLQPKTDYTVRFGENSKQFKFRTMPKDLSQPLRFIEGGDIYHERVWMDQMNALAGRLDPAFIVIGGDLAYANNRTNTVENVKRWREYFTSWKKNAVAPDGRLIPSVVIIGNHEVKGFWNKPTTNAACFYALFSMPGQTGYGQLDFGNYLSLILLDSGMTHPVKGPQAQWLDRTLAERRNVPHVFPIYHVPAYPSVRADDDKVNSGITDEVRENWCPLFEKYGVKLAFEHHDHAFKRTVPLVAEKEDPNGVIYLGDGAWGVNLRSPLPASKRPYLAKGGCIRHFFVVTLFSDQRQILAINDKGEIFDEIYQRVK